MSLPTTTRSRSSSTTLAFGNLSLGDEPSTSSGDASTSSSEKLELVTNDAASTTPEEWTSEVFTSNRPARMAADDTRSVVSFHPSQDSGSILREYNGRTLSATCDTYLLPVDWDEQARQNFEHQMLEKMVGDLTICQKEATRSLTYVQSEPRRPLVLDIGTGDGTWALAMAKQYHMVDVIGIDLAPPLTGRDPPENCCFELDDANLGFPHFEGKCDFIHARSIAWGIRDYPQFFDDLVYMLQPGCIVHIAECDMCLWTGRRRRLDDPEIPQTDPDFSWAAKVLAYANRIVERQGGTTDVCEYMHSTVRGHRDMDDVVHRYRFHPVGAWGSSGSDSVITDMQRHITQDLVRSVRHMLLLDGMDPDVVKVLIKNATRELEEPTVRLYTKWAWAWGKRRMIPPPLETRHFTPGDARFGWWERSAAIRDIIERRGY